MAAIVDNGVESKKEESTPIENSVTETARAKGTIAIGIAKLQPTVRILIAYAKLWAYYTLIPFKVGQLMTDVIILELEITKLFLVSVKANTNLFVQLFQQVLTLFSPDFIQNLLLSSSHILTSLVEKIMQDLLDMVQKFVDGLTKAFKPPFVPSLKLAEGITGMPGIPKSSDAGGVVTEPKSEETSTVNSGTPEKSDKAEKSEKSLPKKG